MKSKAFIEVAGTGAILLGLVFVALELKQNTEAVKAQTSQGLLEMANQSNHQVAASAQLADLYLKATNDFDALSERERLQFSRYVNAELNIWEQAYYSHQNGTMDDGLWRGYDISYRANYCDESSYQIWAEIQSSFGAEFRSHLSAISDEDCTEAGY